jgi:hypothetical protein
MTLAETFLLLVFVIWYGVAPNSRTQSAETTPPEVRIKLLEDENDKLKADNKKLQDELNDINRRLEFWRTRFPDLKIPGSVKELGDLRAELGRGKPACQPDDNLLVNVSFVEGAASVRLQTLPPNLQEAMGTQGPSDLKTGMLLKNPKDIERFLNGVASYRRTIEGEQKECRFDYQLTWASYKDYYSAREKFDRYFYPSVRIHRGGFH